MDAEKSLIEVLGIDKDVLARRCASTTKLLLESKLMGGKSSEEFVAHMEETFSHGELLFLAIGYITDKTTAIMNDDPEIGAIIDRAQAKHNIPQVVVDLVKDSLGVKKQTPN